MSDEDKPKKQRGTAKKDPGVETPPGHVDPGASDDGNGAVECPEVMTTETLLVDPVVEPAVSGSGSTDPGVDDFRVLDQATRNRQIYGELIVHYPERDVSIVLDGASASRVIAVHAGVATRPAMQDRFTPLIAEMGNMWASIDLDRALAMSWIPGLAPIGGRKMTIDPVPPAVLQG